MTERAAGTPEHPVPPVAQIGSIVGAIFAALVGADPFDVRHRTHAVRWLDYVVIALWVLAVVLFLIAAARSAARALTAAIVTVAVAGALTVLALIVTPLGWTVDRDSVLIVPSKLESRAILALCRKDPANPLRLLGSVQTFTLDDDFVVFDFRKQANSRCGTIRIPRDAILTIVEHPSRKARAHGVLAPR
jgi:hypothetical protein